MALSTCEDFLASGSICLLLGWAIEISCLLWDLCYLWATHHPFESGFVVVVVVSSLRLIDHLSVKRF